MALVMPLGALANKLVKIEGDLRFLSMKASEHADEGRAQPSKAVDARLELIHEALDAIKAQLVKLQADLHPKQATRVASTTRSADSSPLHKQAPDQDD